MLRLPQETLTLPTVKPYCLDHRVDTWTTRTHLLLDVTSEDEGGDWVEGADDSLAALIGVRDELTHGDLRPLYLAWLSALTAWEVEDDDEEEYQTCPEPPVPAGLGELTASQRALADFLRVDDDLLAVAAQASPTAPKEPVEPTKKELVPLQLSSRATSHHPRSPRIRRSAPSARTAMACGSCRDPNLRSIAADLPGQPNNRLDHQLPSADQRLRPPACPERPAGGTRRGSAEMRR
ncbi:hypothetical protein [Streptomyces sp. NPDC002671]